MFVCICVYNNCNTIICLQVLPAFVPTSPLHFTSYLHCSCIRPSSASSHNVFKVLGVVSKLNRFTGCPLRRRPRQAS